MCKCADVQMCGCADVQMCPARADADGGTASGFKLQAVGFWL
jgi:hypothetical protein